MSVQPCPCFTPSSFQPSILTPSLSSGTTPTLGTATVSEAFIHPRVHQAQGCCREAWVGTWRPVAPLFHPAQVQPDQAGSTGQGRL